MRAFFVRYDCKYRRRTGGSSRNLQEVDGGNSAARRCGIYSVIPKAFSRRNAAQHAGNALRGFLKHTLVLPCFPSRVCMSGGAQAVSESPHAFPRGPFFWKTGRIAAATPNSRFPNRFKYNLLSRSMRPHGHFREIHTPRLPPESRKSPGALRPYSTPHACGCLCTSRFHPLPNTAH